MNRRRKRDAYEQRLREKRAQREHAERGRATIERVKKRREREQRKSRRASFEGPPLTGGSHRPHRAEKTRAAHPKSHEADVHVFALLQEPPFRFARRLVHLR